MKTALTFVLVLAAACGGKKSDSTAPMAKHADGEHMQMMPEMTAFHDVLKPRWHAEKGPQRMTDTCAAIPQFQTSADALAKAAPPAGADSATWGAGTKALTDAVVALDGTCKANDAAAFEPAFERVHNDFHAVMEQGGGHHEEGEHMMGSGHMMGGDHMMGGEHMGGKHEGSGEGSGHQHAM